LNERRIIFLDKAHLFPEFFFRLPIR
jgi:hypothetical protein